MAFSVGDILQLNARLQLADSQLAENVFHVEVLVTGTDEEVKDACVDYLDDLYNTIAAAQSDQVTAYDILLRNITDNTPTETLAWDTYGGGTNTGTDQMPPGVAALVTATTAVAKTLARKYIPGFGLNQWDGQAWFGSALAVLVDFAVDWIADHVHITSGVELHPVVLRGVSNIPTDFTEAFVRSEAAYQRRRREGVGS